MIAVRYELGESSIRRILSYDYLERKRRNRTGPTFLLLNAQVNNIIEYCSESWEHRIIKYDVLRIELGLKCFVKTLKRRLK
jgi:tRNA splicing ligase